MHVILALASFAAAPLQAQDGAGAAPQGERPAPTAPAEPRGLVTSTAAAAPGYTLLAPLRSASTYLLDLEGQLVREWKSDAPPGNAVQLQGDGRLLRTERVDNAVFHGGGIGGRIREYAPSGELTWEYVLSDGARCLHHDIELLANGNVLAIAWELRTREEAVAAGRDPASVEEGGFWPDVVIEIEPTRPSGGKVVWEWRAFDHLVQDRDPALANHGDVAQLTGRIDVNALGTNAAGGPSPAEMERLRALGYAGAAPPGRGERRDGPGFSDWLHTNAIHHRADLDLIVLSVRTLSEIWVIDHSTTTAEAATSKGGRFGKGGDLLARWGNPRVHRAGTDEDRKLFVQHDARWIPSGRPGAGHLLVFNNGESERKTSSVDEIALSIDVGRVAACAGALTAAEIVWTYTSPAIQSGHISGAERLANGNTLICAGQTGRLVEVGPDGTVVWEYLNAHGGDLPGPGGPRAERGGERGDDRGRGGARGPGGPGGERGPGGDRGARGDRPRAPMTPYGLFRVERYAPDHPGIRALQIGAAAGAAGGTSTGVPSGTPGGSGR